jgi:hypothetical protein
VEKSQDKQLGFFNTKSAGKEKQTNAKKKGRRKLPTKKERKREREKYQLFVNMSFTWIDKQFLQK